MGSDYWKCPNSNRILVASGTDNKASCTCGKTNPKANGLLKETFETGPTAHFKFLLEPATAQEYEAYIQKKYASEEKR